MGSARASVATALAAAVRMAVTSPPWTTQTGAPESGSKRSTRPWCDCLPLRGVVAEDGDELGAERCMRAECAGHHAEDSAVGERDVRAQKLLRFAARKGDHRIANDGNAELVGEAARNLVAVDEADGVRRKRTTWGHATAGE